MRTSKDILWIVAGCVGLGLYFGATVSWRPSRPTAEPPANAWQMAKRSLEASVQFHYRRALAHPTEWVHLERVAQGELGLAHLTGDYEPYARAESALAEAFRRAPEGAGPFVTRARLAFAVHRLDDVEPDLARASRTLLLKKPERRAIRELRAAVAFQQGALTVAEARFTALAAARPTPTILSRLAQVHWKSGDVATADALFLRALDLTPSRDLERRAWLELMRGLLDLDQGRLEAAERHYVQASDILPGWYLIDEHIAEIYALRGQLVSAARQYKTLVDRTHNPEFMDALAALYAGLGRHSESESMTAQARLRYEALLERFPEAAAGHAFEHFLEAGHIDRSVAMAERDAQLRPNGDALGRLATAYLEAGRSVDARTTVERALAAQWITPDLCRLSTALQAVHRAPNASGSVTDRCAVFGR